MKKLILTLIIAIAGTFAATPQAEAGGCNSGYVTKSYCAPKIYKVNTYEVNRCRYKKTAYDKCGRRYCYWVTKITYCDVYSNGQRRTWTKYV